MDLFFLKAQNLGTNWFGFPPVLALVTRIRRFTRVASIRISTWLSICDNHEVSVTRGKQGLLVTRLSPLTEEDTNGIAHVQFKDRVIVGILYGYFAIA